MTKFGGCVNELQVNLLQGPTLGLHKQGLQERYQVSPAAAPFQSAKKLVTFSSSSPEHHLSHSDFIFQLLLHKEHLLASHHTYSLYNSDQLPPAKNLRIPIAASKDTWTRGNAADRSCSNPPDRCLPYLPCAGLGPSSWSQQHSLSAWWSHWSPHHSGRSHPG